MNFDDFSYEDDGRKYIDPQVSLDEQNAFIDNLRSVQQNAATQNAQETQDLGTEVPSNQGGLGGGSSYFTSRYQTPQMNSVVANLKATAQEQALTTLLDNEVAKAKKRYNDAYYAAKKRSNGGGGGGGGDTDLNKLPVDEKNSANAGDKQKTGETNVNALKKAELEKQYEAASTKLKIWEQQLKNYYSKTSNTDRLFTVDQFNKIQEEIHDAEEEMETYKNELEKYK